MALKICTDPSCQDAAHAKGLCKRHYTQAYRLGNTTDRLSSVCRKYGLTRDVAEALLARGVCDVCGSSDRLCVDHCHRSGAVRGLLCNGCNAALGMVDDSVARLEGLAAYVRRAQ